MRYVAINRPIPVDEACNAARNFGAAVVTMVPSKFSMK
jgi:hypothetical protein